MPTMGFEPTISEGERPQTYALDRMATGTGTSLLYSNDIYIYEVVQYGETNIEGKTRRGSWLNIYVVIYVEWK